jgi:transposase
MKSRPAALPENPDELRALVVALQAELYSKTLHIEKLKAQLALLRRARFGRSSEKLDTEIEQLELVIGELEEGQAQSAERSRAALPPALAGANPALRLERTLPVRRILPAHLPRERVEHEAACVCPSCGGTNLTVIGTDERELLEYVPSHFKAVVHARPKVSCRACETITQAPMPSLPIERGLPGPGLLAHVLVSKYCDHLPLHRQSGIYARAGVEIDRSTMAEWVGQMAFLLDPLAESIARHARAGEVLHADDTVVPVLEPGLGRAKKGRLWVLLRDERPWGSRAPPAVLYRYAPDRRELQADALLKDCRGFLHADAYDGFKKLYAVNPVTGEARLAEVGCWAHARRKLYDEYKRTSSPAAQALLKFIGALFAVEDDIKGRPPDERLAVRQGFSVPLLCEIRAMYEKALSQVSGKGEMAKALRYVLSRWKEFTRYTTDGRLEISNNAAERAMRPIAIGRKNWMFCGSDTGGERAAAMYTLIETAKLNRRDPEAYLRAVISRIADHPMKRIDELLPWNIAL